MPFFDTASAGVLGAGIGLLAGETSPRHTQARQGDDRATLNADMVFLMFHDANLEPPAWTQQERPMPDLTPFSV